MDGSLEFSVVGVKLVFGTESDNQSSDCLLFKRGCWGLEPMLGVCHPL